MTSVEYGVAQPQEEIDPDPPSLDASFLDAGIASCLGRMDCIGCGPTNRTCDPKIFHNFKGHGCSGLQDGRLVK